MIGAIISFIEQGENQVRWGMVLREWGSLLIVQRGDGTVTNIRKVDVLHNYTQEAKSGREPL